MDNASLLLLGLFLVPAAGALVSGLPMPRRSASLVAIIANVILCLLAGLSTYHVGDRGSFEGLDGWLRLDALGLVFLLVASVSGLAASLYARVYGERAVAAGRLSEGGYHLLFALLEAAVAVTVLVPLATGLLSLWAALLLLAILTSALISGAKSTAAREASRRYLLATGVGLALAFLGTVFYFWAATKAGVRSESPLDIRSLLGVASRMDDELVRLGFLFLLVGYGTMAGLAPLSGFLPGVYREAPAPVVVLLSTSVGSTALYAIVRVLGICSRAAGPAFGGGLLLGFGLLSLFVAAMLLRGERDHRRLAAHLSLLHLGLCLAGAGLNLRLGAYGAVYAVLAFTPARGLFALASAELSHRALPKEAGGEATLQGASRYSPGWAALFLCGLAAALGLPPFGAFLSQWTIAASATIDAQRRLSEIGTVSAALGLPEWGGTLFATWRALLLALFLGASLVALSAAGLRLVFGPSPSLEETPETPAPQKAERAGYLAAFTFLFAAVALGILLPESVDGILNQAARFLRGE